MFGKCDFMCFIDTYLYLAPPYRAQDYHSKPTQPNLCSTSPALWAPPKLGMWPKASKK